MALLEAWKLIPHPPSRAQVVTVDPVTGAHQKSYALAGGSALAANKPSLACLESEPSCPKPVAVVSGGVVNTPNGLLADMTANANGNTLSVAETGAVSNSKSINIGSLATARAEGNATSLGLHGRPAAAGSLARARANTLPFAGDATADAAASAIPGGASTSTSTNVKVLNG